MITLFDIGALLVSVLTYKFYSLLKVDEGFFWMLLAFTTIYVRYSNAPKAEVLKTTNMFIFQAFFLYLIMLWNNILACTLVTTLLFNTASDTTNIYLFGSKYSRFDC